MRLTKDRLRRKNQQRGLIYRLRLRRRGLRFLSSREKLWEGDQGMCRKQGLFHRARYTDLAPFFAHQWVVMSLPFSSTGGDSFVNGNFLYKTKICTLFLEFFLYLLVLIRVYSKQSICQRILGLHSCVTSQLWGRYLTSPSLSLLTCKVAWKYYPRSCIVKMK